MIRVNSASMLVVPPMECAWLSGDSFQMPEPGKVAIIFEVKADNDATVIFREEAGTKRVVHRVSNSAEVVDRQDYSIIIGSHKNSRLSIEKNGTSVSQSFEGPAKCAGSGQYRRYWVDLNRGVITVGAGRLGENIFHIWEDPAPLGEHIRHVGLSTWDKYIVYRNITMHPCVDFHARNADLSAVPRYSWSQFRPPALECFHTSSSLSDVAIAPGGGGEGGLPGHAAVLAVTWPAVREALERACGGGSGGGGEAGGTAGRRPELPLDGIDSLTLKLLMRHAYSSGGFDVPRERVPALLLAAAAVGSEALAAALAAAAPGSEGMPVDPLPPLHERGAGGHGLPWLLSSGAFSDVVLCFAGHRLPAHRLVLSTHSVVLSNMFTHGWREESQAEVNIEEVEEFAAPAFRAAIEYMYTRSLPAGASDELLLLCRQRMGPAIAVPVVALMATSGSALDADDSCHLLGEEARATLARSFSEAVGEQQETWRDLPPRAVRDVLEDPLLSCDEWMVWEAVLGWAEGGAHARRPAGEECEEREASEAEAGGGGEGEGRTWREEPELEMVLPSVRFPLLSPDQLEDVGTSGLAAHSPSLQELIREAQLELKLLQEEMEGGHIHDRQRSINVAEGRSVVLRSVEGAAKPEGGAGAGEEPPGAGGGGGAGGGSRGGGGAGEAPPKFLASRLQRLQRRLGAEELTYVSDGDRNGLCYKLGTGFGAHDWINPATGPALRVTASSPASRSCDPKSLVAQTFRKEHCAGGRLRGAAGDDDVRPSFTLELIAGHQLLVNYYTLRVDGSMNFPRGWELLGSSGDGDGWHVLDARRGDMCIQRAAQYASYAVKSAPPRCHFRRFRLVLTDAAVSPVSFNLCNVELYGSVRSPPGLTPVLARLAKHRAAAPEA